MEIKRGTVSRVLLHGYYRRKRGTVRATFSFFFSTVTSFRIEARSKLFPRNYVPNISTCLSRYFIFILLNRWKNILDNVCVNLANQKSNLSLNYIYTILLQFFHSRIHYHRFTLLFNRIYHYHLQLIKSGVNRAYH